MINNIDSRNEYNNSLQSKKVIKEFKQSIKNIFNDENFFSLIYGSMASNENTNTSDLDAIIGINKFKEDLFYKTKEALINIHKDNGLILDNEIPYENKLLIDYKDFEKGANLGGFEIKENKVIINDIVKDQNFLSSKEMQSRLIFNILTVPTIEIGNNYEILNKLKDNANLNLVLLGIHLNGEKNININKFLDALLYNKKNGKYGEEFLGYKNNKQVINNLKNIFNSQINTLKNLGVIIGDTDGGYFINQEKVLDILKIIKQ